MTLASRLTALERNYGLGEGGELQMHSEQPCDLHRQAGEACFAEEHGPACRVFHRERAKKNIRIIRYYGNICLGCLD